MLLNGRQVKPIPPFARTAKSGAPVKSGTQLRGELLVRDQPSVVIRKMQSKKGGAPAYKGNGEEGTRSRW